MPITGEMLIGATALRGADKPVRAVEAATGEPMDPQFGGGTAADVGKACALAWAAFDAYRETTQDARARFLEACAQAILDIGDELVVGAHGPRRRPRARSRRTPRHCRSRRRYRCISRRDSRSIR